MLSMKPHSFAASALACLVLTSSAFAQDAAPLTIKAVPGKLVCKSRQVQIGDAATDASLCVKGGNFSHDTYVFSINKKIAVKGIDDETTKGIVASYKGQEAKLTCVPQLQAPTEVSAEKIAAYQDMMKVSAEEARQLAIHTETVEIGRLCTGLLNNEKLIEVQVTFD